MSRSSAAPCARRRSRRSPAQEPATKPAANRSESLDALMNDVIGSTKQGGGAASQPASSETKGAASLPETPSRDDVLRALTGVRGAVERCKAAEGGIATVTVRFKGTTGRVEGARVSDGPFVGTPVGACVAKAVSAARVPTFRQASFNVTFPYRL